MPKSATLKVYEYKACSTCQKALKYLDKKGVEYDRIAIVDQPPSLSDLKKMLAHLKAAGGSFKNLFNTSGVQYRELGLSEKIKAGMTEVEALELLNGNGKLVKRPFVLGADFGMVGFKEGEWEKRF
jgi:arsenate reductase